MSGPKVVRVVTVEEMREVSRGHLVRLEAALAQWERACRRADAARDDDVTATRARVREMAALAARDAHAEVQRRAPAETAWLLGDIERRFDAAARRKADAMASTGRRKRLAAQLLERPTIPMLLRHELEAIAHGDVAAERAEIALSEALRIPAAVLKEQDAGQTELALLAKRLAAGLHGQTFDQWLAASQSGPDAVAEDKTSMDLAKLALAYGEREAEAFRRRYRDLQSLPDTPARRMRLDSLRLELARRLEIARSDAQVLQELETLVAEARSLLNEADLREAVAALEGRDANAAREASKRLSEAMSLERQQRAAAARRQAVLSALADVGYEAHEGMGTITSSPGQIIMRRASNPEVGVEIAGGGQGARLQLRPVRFAAPGAARDPSKDHDIETLWCTDFDGLRSRLQSLGDEVSLEKALTVGAVPVVMIEDPGMAKIRELGTPTHRARRE